MKVEPFIIYCFKEKKHNYTMSLITMIRKAENVTSHHLIFFFVPLQIVILVVMYTEAIIVLIRMENHFRVTRALRPLFLIDTHYCYGVRR